LVSNTSMKKVLLIILLLMQGFVYAGPVCGNHLTAMESMDCCKKGHVDLSAKGISDSAATSCCGTCGVGKAQLLKGQELNLSTFHTIASVDFEPPAETEILSAFVFYDWHRQRAYLSDPPKLFLLKESFRI
jgi:hypothetical protein